MTDAYLVIVSAEGLELITRETTHARRFLARRCFDRRGNHEACYWACLPDREAKLIHWLIGCGQSRSALWVLNTAALDAGPIGPDSLGDGVSPPIFFHFLRAHSSSIPA